ncbi:hypothetical protein BGW38_008689, partial [Lunasporangiospora selenospora]
DEQEVTDIILGKGSRACVIKVEDMSVKDLHRPETHPVYTHSQPPTAGPNGAMSGGQTMASTGHSGPMTTTMTTSMSMHGIGKKLGFKSASTLWHSFEKIPFDVPPHILYPEAAEAVYEAQRDRKEGYTPFHGSGRDSRNQASAVTAVATGPHRVRSSSQDAILQRPSDQQALHQQQQEEQEAAETQVLAGRRMQQLPRQEATSSWTWANSSTVSTTSLPGPTGGPHPHPSHQHHQHHHGGGHGHRRTQSTQMVTSDQVLNMVFSHRTKSKLFLATHGTFSRIVDLYGRPQSGMVLDWEGVPPQKVEFLKTDTDVYVIGFEKTAIAIFSLTRGERIREISKKDLVQLVEQQHPIQQQ